MFRNFVRCVGLFSPEMNYSCTVVTQKSNHMWEMFLIGGGVLVFVAYVAFWNGVQLYKAGLPWGVSGAYSSGAYRVTPVCACVLSFNTKKQACYSGNHLDYFARHCSVAWKGDLHIIIASRLSWASGRAKRCIVLRFESLLLTSKPPPAKENLSTRA